MKFDSKFEKEVYERDLETLPKGTKVWREQANLCYTLNLLYYPDFTVDLADGRSITLECKGYFSPEDRRKMLAVKADWPDQDIRMVFQQNNKIHPKSVTRYSDWCEKHGFKYCIGEIPKDWFE